MKSLLAILLIAIVLLTIFELPVYAQSTNTTDIPTTEAIPQLIDEYIAKHADTTASVGITIFEGEQDIYSTHFGYANIKEQRVSDAETVYAWGSVTKLLTWVSVMQLAEQNKLDLNADIRNYLPDGFLSKIKYDKAITMLDLMNHTAGWQETTYECDTDKEDEILSLEEALKQTEPPQIFPPGQYCAYSNWGASLAGDIVERVSGMPFYEYVQQHIFKPLGMKKTALAPDLSDNVWVKEQRNFLNCYDLSEDGINRDRGTNIVHVMIYPAGMATGTLSDLSIFAKDLAAQSRESKLFQKPDTLNQMRTPTLFYGEEKIPRNSHGLWSMRYGSDVLMHNGTVGGCSASLLFDPQTGRGAVVMTNQRYETIYNSDIMPLIFGTYRGSGNSDVISRKSFSGIYRSTRTKQQGVHKMLGSILPGFFLPVSKEWIQMLTDNEFLLGADDGKAYAYGYMDSEGITRLQVAGQDYLKTNPGSFAIEWGLIILTIFSVLYAFVSLIISVIKYIIVKLRRNHEKAFPLQKYKIINQLSLAMMGILTVMQLFGSPITPATVLWKSIVLFILVIASAGYLLLYLRNYKRIANFPRYERRGYTATMVCTVILILNMVYWQLFCFWI